ncbi:MAG: hypothetical protein JW908_00580 [Anaerolineales bacterium]|nr:hypothetical protein [Anaerolineales bacterium]
MSEPIIEIHIDVSELLRLAEAIPGMSRIIYDEMRKAGEESGMLLTGLIAPLTPVNYGLLRSAIQWPLGYESQGNNIDAFRGIVGASEIASPAGTATSIYVDFVENDTSPHWAPINPLKLYAIRKWGDEKAAYALQAHIARHGTKGKHMFEKGWKAGQGKIQEIWQKVPVKAVQQFERIA